MCSTERGPTVHYTLLVNDTVGHWLIKCDKRAKAWVKVSHSSPGAQTPPSSVTPKFTHGAVGKIAFLEVVGLRISVFCHVDLSVGQLTHNI